MIFERDHFDKSIIKEYFVKKAFDETRNFKFKTAILYKPTVFLSHKHDDLKDLQGVMGLLEELGAKVYIDSMDNKMPGQTSSETALRIKEVIEHCDKFILLATDKAIESYWCNWELGVGDVHKYINHIAIIPMKEKKTNDSQYEGNEYLQIYPYIVYRNGYTTYIDGNTIPKGYYVRMPLIKDIGHTITPLSKWFKL